MTRDEQIIEASHNYGKTLNEEASFDYEDMKCAFKEGAKWTDEHPINVWHDASEEPQDDCKEILYQDKYGAWFFALKYDIVVVLEINWEDFAAENISRWAYIDDLSPKGGKI